MQFLGVKSILILSGLLLGGTPSGTDMAEAGDRMPAKDTIEYRVKLSTIVVARATIEARREDDAYKLYSVFRSSGIANVIAEMEALTDAKGHFSDGAPRPEVYGQEFHRGDKGRRYDIRFADGKVAETAVQPPRTSLPDNWIAVKPEDLAGVADPLSAVFRPDAGSPCTGKLAVFDGEMRFDVTLAPARTEPVEMIGYAGTAEVCKAGFVPVSGYRKGRGDIEWLQAQKDMEVSFIRSGSMEAWVPARVQVPTRLGTLLIEAVRFGL